MPDRSGTRRHPVASLGVADWPAAALGAFSQFYSDVGFLRTAWIFWSILFGIALWTPAPCDCQWLWSRMFAVWVVLSVLNLLLTVVIRLVAGLLARR